MQLYDADLYDLWVEITQGDVANPSQVIRDQFESEYILTDLEHKDFLRAATEDEHLMRVYEDPYAAIFQIVP